MKWEGDLRRKYMKRKCISRHDGTPLRAFWSQAFALLEGWNISEYRCLLIDNEH